jgi:hypothetical protein
LKSKSKKLKRHVRVVCGDSVSSTDDPFRYQFMPDHDENRVETLDEVYA